MTSFAAHAGGPIVLNGRAAARRRVTGVERWAVEMGARLPALAPERYRVVTPPAALTHRAGQLWEQLALPARAARAGAALIFSPANIAPLAWPRNVVVVHDAAVFRHPEAYGRAYRTWHVHAGGAAARRALRVITISEFSRQELIATTGVDPDAVVVIPGGVDERFTPAADAERAARALGLTRPYVLTVGTADRRKNLAALGPVAARLKPLGLEVVWAGGEHGHFEGDDAVPGVRRLGYVSEADLPGLYAGAAAFVLPSLYEGFGLTCIEAMASGVPVVTSDRGALREVADGAALLVDPEDSDAVAEAVVTAATDAGVGERLREAGLRRARGLSWDRAARETHELLIAVAAASDR